MRWTAAQAQKFYGEHKGRPFFDDLCDFMTSGPIVVQVLEGDDAVAKYRRSWAPPTPARPSAAPPQAVCPVKGPQLGARLRQHRLGCAGDCFEFQDQRNCRLKAAPPSAVTGVSSHGAHQVLRCHQPRRLHRRREGSVDWLAPYDARLYGYDKFLAEVGALIMGRRTYEMISAIGEDWPYAGKPRLRPFVAARWAARRAASSPRGAAC